MPSLPAKMKILELLAENSWKAEVKLFSLYVHMTARVSLKIDFKTNLIFLIEPFLYMTKKSTQKRKYLENEKSF